MVTPPKAGHRCGPPRIVGAVSPGTFSHLAFDTGFGLVTVAATDEGVVSCGLPGSDPDELIEDVIARTGLDPIEGGGMTGTAADQIGSYLDGKATRFQLELDWRLIGGFHRKVLQATMAIPYGETASYGEVAADAGSPGAARAAGTALSRNPIALIVPCHRVIRADGSTGGYGGGSKGTRLKRSLLDLERGYPDGV